MYWSGRSTAGLRDKMLALDLTGLRTCVLLLLFSLRLCKGFLVFLFSSSVWQSLLQDFGILLCQTAPQLRRGLAGWMDPPQTHE